MYQLTDIEKLNLETNVLNAAKQIMHLETLLQKVTKDENYQPSTLEVLNQLQNAQRTLDNLMPNGSGIWQDLESDVHISKN